MLKYLGVLVFVSLLVSCEKNIDFAPRNAEQVLVVEGTVENGEEPVIVLSRSLNFFNKISPDLLTNSFVHDADVRISNGTTTHKLKEYLVPIGGGYTLAYYSNDPANAATSFYGEIGKTYSLTINAEGKEYTATTTIPQLTKTIDSVWLQNANSKEDSTKVMLMGRFKDPPGYGNYIRYFTKTNNEPYFPPLNSVYDDQIVDGKTYSVQIEKGVNRNDEIDFEEYSFFNRGDTVTIKLANIDKACFDFWRTIEYSYSTIGNPFASPAKVLTNLKGGALGYFGGYALQYRSFVIPK